MVLNYEMVAFLAFGISFTCVHVCTCALFNRPHCTTRCVLHMSNCTQDSHINVGDTSHISIVNDRINGSCQAPLLKHTLLFLYRYSRMFLSYLRLFKYEKKKKTVTQKHLLSHESLECSFIQISAIILGSVPKLPSEISKSCSIFDGYFWETDIIILHSCTTEHHERHSNKEFT